jgi:signal transduction histidine kinase/CheY-like chemotaxis protein
MEEPEREQWEVFEKIAQALPLEETLVSIVKLIEERIPTALCSILLYDDKTQILRHGATSRLPRAFVEAIDGAKAGPEEGSCGAAAYLGVSVVVPDIATHPNWKKYRELALPLGLRSCWSSPIKAPGALVLGTFALYYPTPHEPTDEDRQSVAFATHAATIALVRFRADQALRESEQRARQLARLYAVSSAINEAIVRVREPAQLYQVACQIAVEKGLARLAWAGRVNDEPRRLEVVARFGEGSGYIDGIADRLLEDEAQGGPADRALRTGRPAVENDIARAPHFLFRAEAATRGLASCAVFPLRMADEADGVLCIYGERTDFFLDEEVRVLSVLAEDLAFAVQSAEHEKERAGLLLALGERVKELTVLHKAARLLESQGPLDHALLSEIAALIPPGFQHPKRAQARIAWGELEAKTAGFVTSSELVRSEFEVDGQLGSVVVIYPESVVARADAFLPEEQALLNSLADMLGSRLRRDQAERKLREGQALLHIASRIAKVGGFQLDAVTGEVAWSQELRDMLGLGLGTFRALEDALPTEDVEQRQRLCLALKEALGRGTALDLELELARSAGKARCLRLVGEPVFDAAGRVVRIQGAFQDVSERRRLEQQFRQAQKMEAVGRLAGGVAHDFNNLLSVILGYVHLALDNDDLGPLRSDLEQIRDAGNRASQLTRQLLAFSRHQVLASRVIDLGNVIDGIERMLKRLVGEDVAVAVIRAKGLGQIFADPGQLEQVLMNLAVNARDAMPCGGFLTLETQNAELTPDYALEHEGVTPGNYVALTVSDTGTGMDRETQTRIFEPFFTTKDEGKGTGLGLSSVWGIVTQSGGHIAVQSELGVGTTFKVYFPRVDPAPEVEEVEQRSKPPSASVQGSETVLVVEDDIALRTLTAFLLRKNGYQVIEANDGVEALLMATHFSAEIALVVTDVVMPKMGGLDLAQRLLATRPHTKVLFVSGYTQEANLRQGELDPNWNFLPKPLTPDQLLPRVRALLDGIPPEGFRPRLSAPPARPRDTN